MSQTHTLYRSRCARTCFFSLWAGIRVAAGELAVETDFEGASAKVVGIEQQERTIRFEPGGDPSGGWPSWWNFRIRGARPGEPITLRLRAPKTVIPQTTYTWLKDKPLSLDWSAPKRAAWSGDGESWQRTEPGARDGEWMVYQIVPTMDPVEVAWGPTYTPSRSERFAKACAEKFPAMVKAESLCRSRDGRSVPLLRIAEGPPARRGAIWIHARQHAWESGSSWVAQGFTEWLLGGTPEATWLRQHHEFIVVPVMDVDHVAKGQGGKEAVPHDHNRDWSDQPHWPEVAAAQAAMKSLIEDGRLAAYIDLHNPGPNTRGVQFHTPPDEGTKKGQRAAINRFHALARMYLATVMPVDEEPLKSGAEYDPTWRRMSHSWVAAHAPESTLPVCVETPWNIAQSSQEGYRKMGAAIGVTIYHYFHKASAGRSR